MTAYVLEALDDGSVQSRKAIREGAAKIAMLPAGAYEETLESGGTRLDQRLNWSITHLNKASLIEQVARARYRITEAGRAWLAEHPEGMDYGEARVFFGPYWPPAKSKPSSQPAEQALPDVAVEDPDELMDSAQASNRADVSEVLLKLLRESHPDFFEQAVVDLLLKMGYGGAEQRGTKIGGSGDGGVDGVIEEDALGLSEIYVQAKRYAEGNNIPANAIQAFVGALHGKASSKGVFITTSTFTPAAREYASAIPTRIRLIDGERLANLMIKYRVGVQTKHSYTTVEVDQDYFE